jgi:hypothetical protein
MDQTDAINGAFEFPRAGRGGLADPSAPGTPADLQLSHDVRPTLNNLLHLYFRPVEPVEGGESQELAVIGDSEVRANASILHRARNWTVAR